MHFNHIHFEAVEFRDWFGFGMPMKWILNTRKNLIEKLKKNTQRNNIMQYRYHGH